MTVLFLHVGWAREYRGAPDDPPLGMFGYMLEGHEDSGEALNFRPYRGRFHGYAPVTTLRLSRLGGSDQDPHADGILVIWTATDPSGTGRYIVGWYRDARVYSDLIEKRPDPGRPGIITTTSVKNGHVVPVDERTFWIPRMKAGWPGISNAFYASDTLSPEHLDRVLRYVDGEPSTGFFDLFNEVEAGAGAGKHGGGKKRPPPDPESNAAVEKAAVAVVKAYYEDQGWSINSVEADNCGWDLEVVLGGRKLLVEVKGHGGEGAVELTPNEYGAMTSEKTRMSYRLAVVWNAQTKKPRLTVFRYRPATDSWVAPCKTVLKLEPKQSAIASFKPVSD